MKLTLAFAILLTSAVSVSASTIAIDTVPIGNPGNPADMRYVDGLHPNGVGAVGYPFRIGRTEITNYQYVQFLNAVAATDTFGLYSAFMDSDTRGGIVRSGSPGSYTYTVKLPALSGTYIYDYKPVVWVSWGDAARFANWLHNGQPIGPQDSSTTEDGAYKLNGATADAELIVITRNHGATWFIPTDDEWYKAAFHKNDGVTGNYWDFSTETNAVPDNNLPASDTGNSANYRKNFIYTTGSLSYPMTNVGAYTLSGSAYETSDQNGNVWEWNESALAATNRGIRGGGWEVGSETSLHASGWNADLPTLENTVLGFRVAQFVPEPTTAALVAFAALACGCRRRRS